MKLKVKLSHGKLIYEGRDKKVKDAIKRINKVGGFSERGPGEPQEGGYTDVVEVIKLTKDNLYMLENYLPLGYEVE